MFCALTAHQSVQMATHAVDWPQGSTVTVPSPMQFAAVMESIAAQKDTPVILQLELVTKELKLCQCCGKCLP